MVVVVVVESGIIRPLLSLVSRAQTARERLLQDGWRTVQKRQQGGEFPVVVVVVVAYCWVIESSLDGNDDKVER